MNKNLKGTANRKKEAMLTHERLLECLSYNPDTGLFTWRVRQGRCGAGTVTLSNYRLNYDQVRIDGNDFKAHRLAWFYMHKGWPAYDIDHIDGDKHNNRIENLRQATRSQNMVNSGIPKSNTSGFRGVTYHAVAKKWQASITVNRQSIYLGLFTTPESASEAYQTAAIKYFGEFANV